MSTILSSSFHKLEISEDCVCDLPNQLEIKTQKQLDQRQRKNGTFLNRIQKSCLKSQCNIDSSTTCLSGTDPARVKTVNFEKSARVRRVRPRNQFTKKEKEFMWYSDNEYVFIKRRAVETVKRMLKGEKLGGFVDDDNYSARGLECRMKKNAIKRKESKAFARDLVLNEQEDQNDKGIVCSVRFRKVYLKASSISSMNARDAGRKDAEAVNGISLCEILQIVELEHKKL